MAKRTVLFLPGTLCTGAVFAAQTHLLSKHGFDCRIADFHEESSIQEMAETALRHIPKGRKAALAGFSMGGMAALALAERYPDRVDRLALLNSNCHPDLPGRRDGRKKYIEQARQTSLREVLERGFLRNYLHLQQARHRELILDMAGELGAECFAAQSKALAHRVDQSDVLAAMDCPVLILGARQDVLCPVQVQQDMHALCGHSRLVLLEECGHFAVLERPDGVNQALMDWLSS